jgi:hypothetical protein
MDQMNLVDYLLGTEEFDLEQLAIPPEELKLA